MVTVELLVWHKWESERNMCKTSGRTFAEIPKGIIFNPLGLCLNCLGWILCLGIVLSAVHVRFDFQFPTTTKAGKVVEGPPMPKSNSMPILQEMEPEIDLPTSQPEPIVEKVGKPKESAVKPAKSAIPYPQRLKKEKREA
ncbi:hypothetical protein OSB04_019645 [Centaurea solstitialis]|uniref:Uncharacterized protein n=1 Tax=Centaurea solstitialis TaxID=347529 RepID=A0AA38W341_9ASTR|nr:hypothetical protein OSB04_019645 [Centaurea solstitialis]